MWVVFMSFIQLQMNTHYIKEKLLISLSFNDRITVCSWTHDSSRLAFHCYAKERLLMSNVNAHERLTYFLLFKYSETSIYRSQIIRFSGSVVQFLWSLSESYFNYGSCIYCFPGSIVSFSDLRRKRWIEVSLYTETILMLTTRICFQSIHHQVWEFILSPSWFCGWHKNKITQNIKKSVADVLSELIMWTVIIMTLKNWSKKTKAEHHWNERKNVVYRYLLMLKNILYCFHLYWMAFYRMTHIFKGKYIC
jgi:hypothetical protein